MPAPKNPPDPPEPQPQPTVTPADEPEWAVRLRQHIESIPEKIRATITDDDRRGIAEGVHDLFERSGAFKPAPKEPEPPAEDEPASEPEPQPNAEEERETWARKWFGKH